MIDAASDKSNPEARPANAGGRGLEPNMEKGNV